MVIDRRRKAVSSPIIDLWFDHWRKSGRDRFALKSEGGGREGFMAAGRGRRSNRCHGSDVEASVGSRDARKAGDGMRDPWWLRHANFSLET